MKNCVPSDHEWNLMQFEKAVTRPKLVGTKGTSFIRASFVCQCGAVKVVVRRLDEYERDDPDKLDTPPPSQGSPELN